MVSKKHINGIIATSLISLGMAATAHAGVTCPSVSSVKEAVGALNTVMRQSERNFFVLSAQPAINESNFDWILVAQVTSNGFDAAFASGQNSVKRVVTPISDEAMEQQGFYICGYFSASGSMSVMTIAPQQQKIIFNPAIINLDTLTKQK